MLGIKESGKIQEGNMKSLRKAAIRFITVSTILITLFCGLSIRSSEADQTQDQDNFVQAIAALGVTYSLSGDELDIVVDQQQAIDAIPSMQKIGVINPDITQTEIDLMPVTHSLADIGLAATTNILSYIFQNSYIYQLHVDTFLSYTDDYGHYVKVPCYSFDFDRDLYNRIDWNNFSGDNLIRIAPNIDFSSWCVDKLNEERQHNSRW